ncbi:MAG TPA: 3'-5' exonuclease [Burkholderiales bacterium]|nr:3'-5' exonuclease [Burkholderiales bacterium]
MNPAPPVVLPADIARSISREDLFNLPIRRYEGKVCLVRTPEELEHARAAIAHEGVVGLDTETRPSFRKGETHLPCLVQVATAHAVYLFQFRELDVFPVLAELMGDPRTVKAGVALAHDLHALKLLFPFKEQNVLDLGAFARRCGLDQTGVRNLAGIFLGLRIPKGARTSNWAAPRLSAAQIQYAATDAWVCRELFLRFESLGLLRPAAAGAPQA